MGSNSKPEEHNGGALMPWMRVAIGVGGSGLVAGLAGMVVWIDDGSHYFELAVAVASTGFLTLVACFLTQVFGSSHGSQDDAFRRGRSMGFDAGYLEGHRTARPVVVPMHAVVPEIDPDIDPDIEVVSSEVDHEDESESPPTVIPMWQRVAMPLPRQGARDRMFDWVVARRVVLVAGAMCLALIGVLVANASVPAAVSAGPSPLAPGTQVSPVDPSHATPPLVSKTGRSGWSVSVGTDGTLAVPGVAGASPVAPGPVGRGPAGQALALANAGVVGSPSPFEAAVVAPSPIYSPPAASPVTAPVVAPVVVPVVAAPAVPLTAAQQTAADAAAAAALTAANAKAAADLTAANAAAAAAETARVAAAAAEATRLKAAADAYAVAHPS